MAFYIRSVPLKKFSLCYDTFSHTCMVCWSSAFHAIQWMFQVQRFGWINLKLISIELSEHSFAIWNYLGQLKPFQIVTIFKYSIGLKGFCLMENSIAIFFCLSNQLCFCILNVISAYEIFSVQWDKKRIRALWARSMTIRQWHHDVVRVHIAPLNSHQKCQTSIAPKNESNAYEFP